MFNVVNLIFTPSLWPAYEVANISTIFQKRKLTIRDGGTCSSFTLLGSDRSGTMPQACWHQANPLSTTLHGFSTRQACSHHRAFVASAWNALSLISTGLCASCQSGLSQIVAELLHSASPVLCRQWPLQVKQPPCHTESCHPALILHLVPTQHLSFSSLCICRLVIHLPVLRQQCWKAEMLGLAFSALSVTPRTGSDTR